MCVVFVCLQEATGTFGSEIQKTIDEYEQKYKNVKITCLKSEKLMASLYTDFFNWCQKLYEGKEQFLLIIDL